MNEAPVEACARCGVLATLVARGSRRLCAECFERARSPIETDPATALNLLRGTAELMRRVWLPATLVSAGVGVVPAAFAAFLEPSWLLRLLLGFWSLIATGVVLDLGAQAVDSELPPAWRPALARSLARWPALAIARVRILASAALASLLLVIPGIAVALGYMLVYPMVLRGEGRGWSLYAESADRMRGHRVQALLAFVVLCVLALTLLIVAGVVAVLAVDLRLGKALALHAGVVRSLGAFLGEILAQPLTLLLVVLDVKLRPRASDSSSRGQFGALHG